LNVANPTIRITGIEKTVARVKGQASASPRKALLKAAIYLRGVLATYPPRVIPSTYIRTHTLGHKWAVKAVSDTLVRVGNNTPYGPFVMDEVRQTRIMKIRNWKTTRQIAREQKREVIRIVTADLKAQIKRSR
jgi:hypothetical protein